ncbi:MAG: 50S ribosomal protein L25 [Myxococcota bacterium]|nr:50S ribosomal protein L25 [Myxococcota bacterium]
MQVGIIHAQVRPGVGKGHARKLRNKGHVPAICYGAGAEPIPVSVDPAALHKALDPAKGRNTLLRMRLEGPEGTQDIPVLLRDTQRDKLTGRLIHVDFLRVRLDQPVQVTVPLVLVGKAEGVKAGGTLHQVYRSLVVRCAPERIPASIEVDVSPLGIGQALHVSDVKLPEGVTSAVPEGTTLCVVVAPKADKTPGQAEAAPTEGAPAEGAPAEAKKEEKAPAKAPAAKAPAAKAPAAKAPAKPPAKGK